MSKWCRWYRVVKCCGRDTPRYIYDQSTRRVNGKTETRNRYIGIAGEAEARGSGDKGSSRFRLSKSHDPVRIELANKLRKAVPVPSAIVQSASLGDMPVIVRDLNWISLRDALLELCDIAVGECDATVHHLSRMLESLDTLAPAAVAEAFEQIITDTDVPFVKKEISEIAGGLTQRLEKETRDSIGAQVQLPLFAGGEVPTEPDKPVYLNYWDGKEASDDVVVWNHDMQQKPLSTALSELTDFAQDYDKNAAGQLQAVSKELAALPLPDVLERVAYIGRHTNAWQLSRAFEKLTTSLEQTIDCAAGETVDDQVYMEERDGLVSGTRVLALHTGDTRFGSDVRLLARTFFNAGSGSIWSDESLGMDIARKDELLAAIEGTMSGALPRLGGVIGGDEQEAWLALFENYRKTKSTPSRAAQEIRLTQSYSANITATVAEKG